MSGLMDRRDDHLSICPAMLCVRITPKYIKGQGRSAEGTGGRPHRDGAFGVRTEEARQNDRRRRQGGHYVDSQTKTH